MVLFGESLGNKIVILSIHYSSINCCWSRKKQLSLSQPLLPLVPLCFCSMQCDSVADSELVLVDPNLGNTKLLVLRSTCPVSDTKFPPLT